MEKAKLSADLVESRREARQGYGMLAVEAVLAAPRLASDLDQLRGTRSLERQKVVCRLPVFAVLDFVRNPKEILIRGAPERNERFALGMMT